MLATLDSERNAVQLSWRLRKGKDCTGWMRVGFRVGVKVFKEYLGILYGLGLNKSWKQLRLRLHMSLTSESNLALLVGAAMWGRRQGARTRVRKKTY